jgi:ATP-dependent Lon protease
VSKKINTAVDESLSKQQKEFFLRQQLAAIQRELHLLHRSNSNGGSAHPSILPPPMGEAGSGGLSELDDDEQREADDMADLKRRVEAMEPGSEEPKMGVSLINQ